MLLGVLICLIDLRRLRLTGLGLIGFFTVYASIVIPAISLFVPNETKALGLLEWVKVDLFHELFILSLFIGWISAPKVKFIGRLRSDRFLTRAKFIHLVLLGWAVAQFMNTALIASFFTKKYSIEGIGSIAYLRAILEFSVIPLLIISGNRKERSGIRKFYIGLLFVIIIIQYLFFSSRGSLLLFLFTFFLHGRQNVHLKSIAFILLSFILMQLLMVLRSGESLSSAPEEVRYSYLQPLTALNWHSYNKFEFVTSQENFTLMYGSTMIGWAIAPIPRGMWQSKPLVSYGQYLGEQHFSRPKDRPGGGVPLGFPFEAYWNFGYLGIVIAFFYGVIVRLIDSTLYYSRTHFKRLIFLLYFIPLTMGLYNGDLNRVMVGLIINSIGMLIFYKIRIIKC